MNNAWVCLAVLLLLLGPGRQARAEIFEWTDADGQLHFTQDISQVPVDQRSRASERASTRLESSKLQQVEMPKARSRRVPGPGPASFDPGAGTTHRVPFYSAAGAMIVSVRFNDQVEAPFIIDTGASDVVLPGSVADQLGIRVDGSTPHQVYGTANGNVRVPVITLESVQIGDARVENVRAAIMPRLNTGLLGLSFFDHFTYHVDRDRGFVTLVRNGRDGQGSEAHWRRRFVRLRSRIAQVEQRMTRLSPAHSRQLRDLKAQRESLVDQLHTLDVEADRSTVPHAWR